MKEANDGRMLQNGGEGTSGDPELFQAMMNQEITRLVTENLVRAAPPFFLWLWKGKGWWPCAAAPG